MNRESRTTNETPFTWSECILLGVTVLLSVAILGIKGYQLYCAMVTL